MQIVRLPLQIAESVLGVVGVRVGTEEPHFLRRPLTPAVELRRYGPRIAAETVVAGDEENARNDGFRRLAGYICASAATAGVPRSRRAPRSCSPRSGTGTSP